MPIAQLHPARPVGDGGASGPQDALTDADLLDLYARPDRRTPFLRVNFVASVDGSATAEGLTAALGGPADLRVFDLLRRLADVVLVAAGTVRSEGYGAMRLPDEAARWRVERGLPPHPVFAVVSGSLDLDPASDVFAKAPVRPIVLTHDAADPARRAALSEVADVVSCGATTIDQESLVAALVARGLPQIHCEGGPGLLGALVAADLVDALCLTISPALEGGAGPRIDRAPEGVPPVDLQELRLDHVLLAGDMLLTQYSRPHAR
ncbi:2,5-diamino-6-ribosylamino-4(3H)-pyrimidinone 5'-phosphate reductase [Frondihabitans sp. 762G35]|uniref:pyrimidine reductase family protein n=1 Tax=Frondihabitans sp. 762G35 TaxID=1446794 RepID=UPI000D2199AC|nr:pyrimidine reductase family protein [Frondihabitans sp. 762G35]ARC58101.1 2,5-diamino-6-ribosylamino-4(3H)-pyrimidinone 5'-phosphate reductase [Frondihabitans sp. 762G35]